LSWPWSCSGTPNQGEDDVGWQREGQRGDQVEFGFAADGVEQLRGSGLDGGDHRGHALHAERAGSGPAQPGVRGLVQAGHGGLRPVTAREEDLLGFGGQRDERGLGDGGGVRRRVAEHFLDLGVPGHDVVADRGGEEDRRFGLGHDRERVGEKLGR
jgi:hypothetical protein